MIAIDIKLENKLIDKVNPVRYTSFFAKKLIVSTSAFEDAPAAAAFSFPMATGWLLFRVLDVPICAFCVKLAATIFDALCTI